MKDYQALIDRIIAAVDMPELPLDELRSLSQQYADACMETNLCLARCGQYIRVGNCAEAVRLAETTPPLLEICNILDYPGREDWLDLCKSLHLAIAPILTFTIIEQLNEAYTTYYSIEELLKKNRKLVLLRASLADRLTVLHKLAQKEPQNLIWSEMADKFEKARLEELNEKYQTARKSKNALALMKELDAELKATTWVSVSAEALRKEIEVWFANADFQIALIGMGGIASELEKAVADSDLSAGKTVLAQWKAFLQSKKIPLSKLPEELKNTYLSCEAKLKEQEHREEEERQLSEGLQRLEQGILEEANGDRLKEIYQTVEKMYQKAARELPDATRDRYQFRLIKERARRNLRRAMFAFFALAIVFMVVTFTFFYVSHLNRKKQINQKFDQIETYLDSFDLYYQKGTGNQLGIILATEAMDAALKGFPDLSKDSRVTFFQERVSALTQNDQKRRSELTEKVKKVEESLLINSETPSRLDRVSLAEARKLSRSVIEQRNIEKLESLYEIATAKAQRVREQKIETQVDEIRDQINDMREQPYLTEEQIKSEETRFQKMIEDLQVFLQEVPLTAVRQEELRETLKSALERQKTIFHLKNILEKSVSELGDLSGYLSFIKNLVEQFPQSGIKENLSLLEKGIKDGTPFEKWNQFAEENISLYQEYGNDRRVSENFRTVFSKYYGELEMIPQMEEIRRNIDFLAPLIKSNGRQGISEKLDRLMSPHNISLWSCVKKRDNQDFYYYFTQNPTDKKMTGYGNGGTDQTAAYREQLTEDELRLIKPAPHSLAIKMGLTELQHYLGVNRYSMADWYLTLEDILKEFNPHEYDGMDPVIKVFFLRNLFEALLEDPFFARYFSATYNELNNPALGSSTDWFDPAVGSLLDQRILTMMIFGKLTPFRKLFSNLHNDVRRLTDPIFTRYELFGISYHHQGKWYLIPRDKTVKGTLFISRYSESDSKVRVMKIGTFEEGKVQDLYNEQYLLSGLPVYILKKR